MVKEARAPTVADVIFRARADQCGMCGVAIEVDFDGAFFTDAVRIDGGDGDVGAKETAPSGDARKDFKIAAQLGEVLPVPTGVKIKSVLRLLFAQGVIDVIKKDIVAPYRFRCERRLDGPYGKASGRSVKGASFWTGEKLSF